LKFVIFLDSSEKFQISNFKLQFSKSSMRVTYSIIEWQNTTVENVKKSIRAMYQLDDKPVELQIKRGFADWQDSVFSVQDAEKLVQVLSYFGYGNRSPEKNRGGPPKKSDKIYSCILVDLFTSGNVYSLAYLLSNRECFSTIKELEIRPFHWGSIPLNESKPLEELFHGLISHNTSIEKLTLERGLNFDNELDNSIDELFCESIGKAMLCNQTIRWLCLAHSNIKDQGAIKLAEYFQNSNAWYGLYRPCLRIELNNNLIGNLGVQQICESLQSNEHIKAIDISENSFDERIGLKACKEMLKSNWKIDHDVFWFCSLYSIVEWCDVNITQKKKVKSFLSATTKMQQDQWKRGIMNQDFETMANSKALEQVTKDPDFVLSIIRAVNQQKRS